MRWIPGLDASGVRGVAHVFSLLFYLYSIVVALRADRILEMIRRPALGERLAVLLILLVLVLLYSASTRLSPLIKRYEESGSRLSKRFTANIPAVTGFILLMVFLLAAVLSPLISPHHPVEQANVSLEQYRPPSWSHPMGTDKFGRDVLSRVLYGSRVSLSIGFLAVFIAAVLGLILGAVSGYAGGAVDEVVMRVVDGLLSFPRLLLLLLLVAFFSSSFGLIVCLIAGTSWMGIARLVRAEVLSIKEREYIQAAVAVGMGRRRILWKHLLPNAIGPVIVAATLQIGVVILLESTLSFLGLGIQPPIPSWGNMVFDGREVLLSAWWVTAFPGTAIAVVVISCNLLGDGLRDAMDIRLGE